MVCGRGECPVCGEFRFVVERQLLARILPSTRAGVSGRLGSSDPSQTGHSVQRAGPQRLTAALGSVVVLFALMTNGQHPDFPPWKDFVEGHIACGTKAYD